jgi:hypothetical protein
VHGSGKKNHSRIYNISKDSWTTLPALGRRISGRKRWLWTDDGRLIIVLGKSKHGPEAVYQIDLEKARWSSLGADFPFGSWRTRHWTGEYYYVFGDITVRATGGCENPPANMGCDPWVDSVEEPRGRIWKVPPRR